MKNSWRLFNHCDRCNEEYDTYILLLCFTLDWNWFIKYILWKFLWLSHYDFFGVSLFSFSFQPTPLKSFKSKSVSHTTLIVFIIIFILIAISLFITVILLLRKNRLYRTQLFSPGTNMKRLKEDDLHELIDDWLQGVFWVFTPNYLG